jgi:hypothetical protein
MKPLDDHSFDTALEVTEERANRIFARSVVIVHETSTTYIHCGRTRLATSLVVGFVLLSLLSFFACLIGLMGLRGLMLPLVFALVGVATILSRESAAASPSGITLQTRFRPFLKEVSIPAASVASVRVEAFRDTPWDCYVAIVTPERRFRFAAGISESSAHEVAAALRDRLSAA